MLIAVALVVSTRTGFGWTFTSGFFIETDVIFGAIERSGSLSGQIIGTAIQAPRTDPCIATEAIAIHCVRPALHLCSRETPDAIKLFSNIPHPC